MLLTRLLPLIPVHAAVAATVQARCFETAWDTPAMATVLTMPGIFGWLALTGDDATGMIIGRRVLDETEILMIGVVPEARRRGLGHRLVMRTKGTITFLEVAVDNSAALAFYRNLGFERVGHRPGYYQRSDGTTIDALILRA